MNTIAELGESDKIELFNADSRDPKVSKDTKYVRLHLE